MTRYSLRVGDLSVVGMQGSRCMWVAAALRAAMLLRALLDALPAWVR